MVFVLDYLGNSLGFVGSCLYLRMGRLIGIGLHSWPVSSNLFNQINRSYDTYLKDYTDCFHNPK